MFDDENSYEKAMKRMQEEEDAAIRRALARQQSIEKNEELKKKAKEVQEYLDPKPKYDVFDEDNLDPNKGLTIDETFRKHLPNNLYYDHYSLAQMYPSFTPDEWRRYMRDNQTFIEGELAAIAEAEARAALSRLGKATGNEVSALKAILEKSKLINDSQKQATKIIMTFLPPNSKKKESTFNEGF